MSHALVERMPEQFRGSHRTAGNWGVWPTNGAVREIIDALEARELELAQDEYDRVICYVGDRTRAGFFPGTWEGTIVDILMVDLVVVEWDEGDRTTFPLALQCRGVDPQRVGPQGMFSTRTA